MRSRVNSPGFFIWGGMKKIFILFLVVTKPMYGQLFKEQQDQPGQKKLSPSLSIQALSTWMAIFIVFKQLPTTSNTA